MTIEKANTFKVSTVMLLILGLIIPLWPISLPLCWYFAYRSYKSGSHGTSTFSGESGLDEIRKAKELLDLGVIDIGEFESIKRRHIR